MKYLIQFSIILLLSFIGELLSFFIPLPIPASIYGLFLMFILLCTKVLKLSHEKEASDFLIEIMPVMFIPVTVGIMDSYTTLTSILPEILIVSILGTCVVMGVSAIITQIILKRKRSKKQ